MRPDGCHAFTVAVERAHTQWSGIGTVTRCSYWPGLAQKSRGQQNNGTVPSAGTHNASGIAGSYIVGEMAAGYESESTNADYVKGIGAKDAIACRDGDGNRDLAWLVCRIRRKRKSTLADVPAGTRRYR